jgi:antibiotic biosynthesis monooxygenase (ABM) superfamily enzyme
MTHRGNPRDTGATQLLEFEPKPGAAPALEMAIDEWMASLEASEGFLGIGLFRPSPPHRSCFRVALQFDDVAKLQRWEAGADREQLMTRCEQVAACAPKSRVLPGIETWFRLASHDRGKMMPTRFKMTVVMFLGMFPVSVALHHALKRFPELLELPSLVVAAALTACVTFITMYVAVPILTGFLYAWLYSKPKPH